MNRLNNQQSKELRRRESAQVRVQKRLESTNHNRSTGWGKPHIVDSAAWPVLPFQDGSNTHG
jgi:hypothetical protein